MLTVILKDETNRCYIGKNVNGSIESFVEINSLEISKLCDDLQYYEFYLLDVSENLVATPIKKSQIKTIDGAYTSLHLLEINELVTLANTVIYTYHNQ